MILLDTDVILDVLLDREPHVEASAALLARLEDGGPRAFVAWHTLSNLWYLVRPTDDGAAVRDLLADLTRLAVVVPAGGDALRHAASLNMPDFDDAMQAAAAHAAGARWIATRDVRDFQGSPVPARTPGELLEELG